MRYELIVTSIIGVVGLTALYYLANKLGFKQAHAKKDIIKVSKKDQEPIMFKKNSYTDLTTVISPQTIVFPNDPMFSSKPASTISEKFLFNLCEMKVGNHMRTHIDFPAHMVKEGKVSSD